MAWTRTEAADAYLNDSRSNTTRIYLCSRAPATFLEASSTYALGYKATPTLGAIGNRVGGGRQYTIAAITDGVASVSGTPTHFALVNQAGSVLLLVNSLKINIPIQAGTPWTSLPITISVKSPEVG
jgi:hypothetical protein